MITLRFGDCLVRLDEIEEGAIDALISDPPYDLTAVSRGGSARQAGAGPYGRHTLDTKGTRGFIAVEVAF